MTDIAIEGSRAWLRSNLHALDPDHDVAFDVLVRPGSQDLQALFSRNSGVPLANDTSFGVGHAPLSDLERLALEVERSLHARDRGRECPGWGEDIKIMAVRRGTEASLTVACAMIGRFLSDMDCYLEQKAALADWVRKCAHQHGFTACTVHVNAADDVPSGSVYLTVTGTSAEAGDDGQVGRGNRVNGLITPYRPMSLEAAAGKNPVSHVGKIYNILAAQIAARLVATVPEIVAAHCLMLSQIGAPVSEPALVHIKLATQGGAPPGRARAQVEELVAGSLAGLSELISDVAAGSAQVF